MPKTQVNVAELSLSKPEAAILKRLGHEKLTAKTDVASLKRQLQKLAKSKDESERQVRFINKLLGRLKGEVSNRAKSEKTEKATTKKSAKKTEGKKARKSKKTEKTEKAEKSSKKSSKKSDKTGKSGKTRTKVRKTKTKSK